MKIGLLLLVSSACLLSSCAGFPPIPMLKPVPDAEAVGIYHQVKKGETLSAICRTYQADCQEVAEMNGIRDADHILAGRRVFIPDITGPARKPGGKPPAIKQWHGKFIWPLDGTLTSRFGIRNGRRHDGIDIGAPEGTEIRAAADGKVLYAGDQQTGYGNLVIIRHAEDMITVYAHNQKNLVREDQQVKQGEIIALVGRTGRSTGPHLHFEIRKRTKPRNPLFFLPKPP
jgi:murein DD-endopeptidase MepM/ murein hydrolase activator NlpD